MKPETKSTSSLISTTITKQEHDNNIIMIIIIIIIILLIITTRMLFLIIVKDCYNSPWQPLNAGSNPVFQRTLLKRGEHSSQWIPAV